jgi:large subunit ribosomal protein L4
VRSHAYGLTKKVRALGLKIALSAKQAEGKLIVVDGIALKDAKTKAVVASFKKLGLTKPLFITGKEVDAGFANAISNLIGHDVLPTQGANVYDILRHKELVLTKEAVAALQERLA